MPVFAYQYVYLYAYVYVYRYIRLWATSCDADHLGPRPQALKWRERASAKPPQTSDETVAR